MNRCPVCDFLHDPRDHGPLEYTNIIHYRIGPPISFRVGAPGLAVLELLQTIIGECGPRNDGLYHAFITEAIQELQTLARIHTEHNSLFPSSQEGAQT
jgi:hypothetical protein